MSIWFFANICIEYSEYGRVWKEFESEPYKIICTKNIDDTVINIDDLYLCYKHYREANPDLLNLILNTPLPENTKIFCNWKHNERECFEDMQINPRTYADIFVEAFELNGICKNIKLYLIDKNKILFYFIK